MEILWGRRCCHKIFKVIIHKNLEPRILYIVRLSFKNKGKIEVPRKEKPKGVCNDQASIIWNAKETA